jgi:hypothetical protein
MMEESITGPSKMGLDMVSVSITSTMETYTKVCGGRTRDMVKVYITIRMVKFTEVTTSKVREKVLVPSTIKMEIGMRVSGRMEILMGSVLTTIVLEKCTWDTIKITKEMGKEDIFIRMESYMMVIGRMEIKKEWAATSMAMVSTWVNVISASVMAREYTSSKMALAMRVTGSKVSVKAGVSTSMPTAASILENIKVVSGKELVCTNITIKKSTKEIGRKTKRMVMG